MFETESNSFRRVEPPIQALLNHSGKKETNKVFKARLFDIASTEDREEYEKLMTLILANDKSVEVIDKKSAFGKESTFLVYLEWFTGESETNPYDILGGLSDEDITI